MLLGDITKTVRENFANTNLHKSRITFSQFTRGKCKWNFYRYRWNSKNGTKRGKQTSWKDIPSFLNISFTIIHIIVKIKSIARNSIIQNSCLTRWINTKQFSLLSRIATYYKISRNWIVKRDKGIFAYEMDDECWKKEVGVNASGLKAYAFNERRSFDDESGARARLCV